MKAQAEKYGSQELIVVSGVNQPSSLRIMAQTFSDGDPSFAGPLAGVALGLKTYHILELKEFIPAEVWNEQMAMYELELEEETQATIRKIMQEGRKE